MFSAIALSIRSVAMDINHATPFHYMPLSQKYKQLEVIIASVVVSLMIFFRTATAIDSCFPGNFGIVSMVGTTLLANAIGYNTYVTVLKLMLEQNNII